MWMVELTEDKLDTFHGHTKKALHHIGKICDCIEELREKSRGDYRDDEEYEYEDERFEERRGRSGSRSGYRGGRSGYRGVDGRYSSY